MRRKPRRETAGWGEAINRILPGDHTHYVAPCNREPAVRGMSAAGLDATEAAMLKRMRKLLKNRDNNA